MTNEERQKLREELDEISGHGALGRKCSYCGGAMGHFRLSGYKCLNPTCHGLDVRTGMSNARATNPEPPVRLG